MAYHFVVVELSDLLSIEPFSWGIKTPILNADLRGSYGLISLEVTDLVVILLEALKHLIFNITLVLLNRVKHLPLIDHFHVVCLRGIIQLLTIFLEILRIRDKCN